MSYNVKVKKKKKEAKLYVRHFFFFQALEE